MPHPILSEDSLIQMPVMGSSRAVCKVGSLHFGAWKAAWGESGGMKEQQARWSSALSTALSSALWTSCPACVSRARSSLPPLVPPLPPLAPRETGAAPKRQVRLLPDKEGIPGRAWSVGCYDSLSPGISCVSHWPAGVTWPFLASVSRSDVTCMGTGTPSLWMS